MKLFPFLVTWVLNWRRPVTLSAVKKSLSQRKPGSVNALPRSESLQTLTCTYKGLSQNTRKWTDPKYKLLVGSILTPSKHNLASALRRLSVSFLSGQAVSLLWFSQAETNPQPFILLRILTFVPEFDQQPRNTFTSYKTDTVIRPGRRGRADQ